MSVTSVPGFKAIPPELLATPKPCYMTADELVHVLEQLEGMGLIALLFDEDGTLRFSRTARGVKIMGGKP